jgi:hypothetical protein
MSATRSTRATPWIRKASLALGSVLLVVGAAEGLIRLTRLDESTRHEALTALYDFQPDEEFGYIAAANATHHAVKGIAGGASCYDVVYTTDRFGRRSTSESQAGRAGHLLLFGGSVTFGEGLDEKDLLQTHLSREFAGRAVYNYALPGYGPSHALARVRSGTLPDQVVPQSGSALYLLIPAHVDRVIGTTRTPWVYDSPHFVADEADGVSRMGSFRSARPWRTTLYERLVALRGASALVEELNFHLPLRISDDAMDLVARVLGELRVEYREQFRGELWVVLHPLWAPEGLHGLRVLDGLRQRLSELGVPQLDYASYRETAEDRLGECDPHPSGILNARLGRWIARDLRPQAAFNSTDSSPGSSH